MHKKVNRILVTGLIGLQASLQLSLPVLAAETNSQSAETLEKMEKAALIELRKPTSANDIRKMIKDADEEYRRDRLQNSLALYKQAFNIINQEFDDVAASAESAKTLEHSTTIITAKEFTDLTFSLLNNQRDLADYQSAKKGYSDYIAQNKAEATSKDPKIADYLSRCYYSLAGIARIEGRLDEASNYLDKAGELYKISNRVNLDFCWYLVSRGHLESARGAYASAEKTYGEALKTAQSLGPDADNVAITIQSNLVPLLSMSKRKQQATEMAQKAIEQSEKKNGKNSLLTAQCLSARALLYNRLDTAENEKAVNLLLEAQSIRRNCYGSFKHPDITWLMLDLSYYLNASATADERCAEYAKSLSLGQVSEESPLYRHYIGVLGFSQSLQGKYKPALINQKERLRLTIALHGDDACQTAAAYKELADCCNMKATSLDDFPDAKKMVLDTATDYIDKAIAIVNLPNNKDWLYPANYFATKAITQEMKGDWQGSAASLTQSVNACVEWNGKGSAYVYNAKRLANVLIRMKKLDEARNLLATLLQIQTNTYGVRSKEVADIYKSISMLENIDPESERNADSILQNYPEETLGITSFMSLIKTSVQGKEKNANERLASDKSQLQRALAKLGDGPFVVSSMTRLADTYHKYNATDKALALYAQALQIMDEGCDADDPNLIRLLDKYSKLLSECSQEDLANTYKERAAKIRASLSAGDRVKNQ